MKRLPTRVPEDTHRLHINPDALSGAHDAAWRSSAMFVGSPVGAPDTGERTIVGDGASAGECDATAPAASGGAALADWFDPAASVPAPGDVAGLTNPAADSSAEFVVDTGFSSNVAEVHYTDLDSGVLADSGEGAPASLFTPPPFAPTPAVFAYVASEVIPPADSVAFINGSGTGSNVSQISQSDLYAAVPVTAQAILASPAEPPAGSTAAFDGIIGPNGTAIAHAPQGMIGSQSPHAGLDTVAPADGDGVTGPVGSFAAVTPAPAALASLANSAPHASSAATTDSAIGSLGATGAQVQQALDESGLSVNGAGIKVGVLSDSFNDLGGAAADEADGALPPASDIDVIKDLASGGTDEGRAMMQIIHDVAPGASLAFYTAFDSEQDFASGILALAAAGCKVIVDDVSYFDEPFFQNGVVAQAIQTVEAEGVTYVTAAGNNASNAYQAAWTPISGTYDGKTLTDAESFAGSLVQTVTINTEGTGHDVPLLLEWNQAYGDANSDLEMLVFNSSGKLVGTATNASSGEPTNPWAAYDFTASGTYYVAVENLSGPDPGLIKEITEGDGLPATISGANAGSVYGHAMTPGAITAGAVNAADTPAFGVNPALSESFSSSGAGTELLFSNSGTALSAPDELSPVAVSGVDDINTTVSDLSDFYGTSAAAASLAGVAALILSANPALTPAEVELIMEETALPMANSAVSGAGLVQVDAAVADAVAVPHVVQVDGSTSLTAVADNYFLDDGGSGPELKIGGAPVVTGEFSGWAPIGAVQTANGYEVAWQGTGSDEFTVWDTDSSGNFISTTGVMLGTSSALESYEPIFDQNLNGDGKLTTTVLQTDGSTSLIEVGDQVSAVYYLNDGSGPSFALKLGGADVTAAEFGGWAPIGAVQTASGYEVAWQGTGSDEYTVWDTDSSGNFISTTSVMSGTTLESLYAIFDPILNGAPAASAFSLQYKGFDYVAFFNSAYEDSDSLPSLVQTGANSIEATLDYGIDVQTSQVVADPNYTDSLTALGDTIAQAESLGLSVMVRPLIDFLNPTEIAPYSVGDWRQDYQPTNVAAFFASYQQMIVQEAEVAQANGAQMLSIGAELDQLTGPQYLSYWTDIITAVRQVFTGELTYSASWNTASEVSFWSQLNYEGIDCYVPLSSVPNPTLQELISGWTQPATGTTNPGAYAVIGNESPIQYFENLSAQSGKPLLFTELGYANDSGAAADPSASGNSPDPALQAELYQAFFQAWAQSGSSSLIGTYFWEWDPNGSASNVGPGVDTFSPQNSPAQAQATAGFESADGVSGSLALQTSGAAAVEGGASAADAPVTRALVSGSFIFHDLDSTGAPTVTVSPQNAGSGYNGTVTVDLGNAANGHVSVAWHFDLGTDAITQTITQAYEVTVSDGQPNGTATHSLSITVGGPGNDTFVFSPGIGSDVIVNATSADKIELDGFSSVTNVDELRTLLHEAQSGQSQSLFHTTHDGKDTVIHLGDHDSITLTNVHLAELHANNFIIR